MKVKPYIKNCKNISEQYQNLNLYHLDELHVLKLLLSFGHSKKNSSQIAHNLFCTFGDLKQILESPIYDLEKVPGVSSTLAAYISLPYQIYKYAHIHHYDNQISLKSIQSYGCYLKNYFIGTSHEMVLLLCLDAAGNLLMCQKVCEGSVSSVHITVRNVAELALQVNAVSVILAHNHPSDELVFSASDISFTQNLATALSMLDIIVLDHVLITNLSYASMVQQGLYNPSAFYPNYILTIS